MTDLSWFPGHMAKAKRVVKENIKLVDVVLEILDARIPASSRNPDIVKICGRAPRLVVLNKSDLADASLTRLWEDLIMREGTPVVSVNGTLKKSLNPIPKIVQKLAAPKMQKLLARGRRQRAIRCLLVGIPNVGKSSIINSLSGRKVARVEDRPGVTRGKQWIKAREDLEFLDTAGILYPKTDDPLSITKLVATGAAETDEQGLEDAALWLLEFLSANKSASLEKRYNLPSINECPGFEILQEIGQKRGMLIAGGKVNFPLAIRLVLKEYQTGLLGRATLDIP